VNEDCNHGTRNGDLGYTSSHSTIYTSTFEMSTPCLLTPHAYSSSTCGYCTPSGSRSERSSSKKYGREFIGLMGMIKVNEKLRLARCLSRYVHPI
jgi:hypothetical protein